jgi:large subunit ribosomal protein L24
MATKHVRPTRQMQQGGIIHQEAPIHISNVMLLCKKCDKPTRIGMKMLDDGTKVRVCKKCGEDIDK